MKTSSSNKSATEKNNSQETLSRCVACGSDDLVSFDTTAELVRCRGCSFVFANPRPTLSALETYYSKPGKYEDWIQNESERDALWKRRLRIMDKSKKLGTLLDVGAGIGQLLSHARGHYTGVYGTELSDSGIEIARSKYGLDLIKGDFESISFSRTFDNITLFHILEHVPDPRKLLEKCYRLLTPGGRLMIAVPNDLNSWELKIRTAIKRAKGTLPAATGWTGLPKIVLDGTVDEIHLSQFTVDSLRNLLTRCGYSIVSESLDPYFAKRGWKLVAFNFIYAFHKILHSLFGINRYSTIWMVARRP